MSGTIEIWQPLPSEAAKRALFKVDGLTVSFDGAKKADEKAALAYLDELIEWWNMPCREWRPRGKR